MLSFGVRNIKINKIQKAKFFSILPKFSKYMTTEKFSEKSELLSKISSSAIHFLDQSSAGKTLKQLKFNNVFSEELPRDENTENIIRQVESALYTPVKPTPTGTEPITIAASDSVASLIGLNPEEFKLKEFAMIFSGNTLIDGSDPYAQCYGGHQFGNWAGQLGDGRAITLGEVTDPNSNLRWELQLKGAGKTPYSRMADGRAVLRSSIREYVASEAMVSLGIPSTRALSLVSTGDKVMRDMFYDGNVKMEPGAVVCRVARTFIRFGTFQLPASRGDYKLVKVLADFVIKEYYSDALQSENKYYDFLRSVSIKTAMLVAEWQRVGFVHGVLNTDNMSIIGDTIDYGPFGWLERFDPIFTPNTTDLPGRRYCFQSQPEICQWNLVQLAHSLIVSKLITEDEAMSAVSAFGETFLSQYKCLMAKKLGLESFDENILKQLQSLMYDSAADYTNTYRALGNIDINSAVESNQLPKRLVSAFGDTFDSKKERSWIEWMKNYKKALDLQTLSESERRKMQNSVNPAIVPRNHILLQIISEVEKGNYDSLHKYLKSLKNPYIEEGIDSTWLQPAPSKARLGIELLSCSS